MNIGFHCFDHAGGDAMKIMAEAAGKVGHSFVLFPKQVRGLAQKAPEDEMVGLDAMVTGLSSFETEQELAFADICIKRGIPWFVFEDVPGACLRPKAKDLAPRAKLVILAHPSGAQAALDFGYAGSVYLGPPPQWRVEYEKLTQAKAEKRRSAMLKSSHGGWLMVPLRSDDKVIGLIGGKDPAENNRVIGIVASAVSDMYNVVLAFSRHPGEKPNPDKPGDTERFDKLMTERSRILERVTWADTASWIGSCLAATVNVMVYASGTNISIAGAYARVPAVYLDDEGVRERMRAQSGQDKWFVAELGGASCASDLPNLKSCLHALLISSLVRQDLYHSQEKAFPLPEDWHTETKIIRFLEQILPES